MIEPRDIMSCLPGQKRAVYTYTCVLVDNLKSMYNIGVTMLPAQFAGESFFWQTREQVFSPRMFIVLLLLK